jgi:hypothetical protein
LYHTTGTIYLVGIDVKMYFHFTIYQYRSQSLEHFTGLVDFVHQSHAGTILALIIVSFTGDFAEYLASVAAIYMYYHCHGILGPPGVLIAVTFGIGS